MPQFAALIGLDWGDAQHALALLDPATGQVETSTLVHSAEELTVWLQKLRQRFGGRAVALALETSKGPLIHLLVDAPWVTVYPIHPATSARYRKAFAPSGAKDDAPDALVLLDLLRHHSHRLRPLVWQDAATRQLGALCELRRKSVDQRTHLTNQMRSLLKAYFPQALLLVGEVLHSPLALDFLSRWPDLISLKASKASTVRAFYYGHSVRRPETVQTRLELIARAVALTTDPAIVSVHVRHLQRLIQQVRVLQKHIAADEKEIAQQFKSHPDAELFANLPGAGPALAPRLLVGFGSDRACYANAAEFQRYSGVAPVKEKSGGRVWIHWRWNAPGFLRQSLIEWAGQSTLYCPWAKAYYDQQRAKGKRHWASVRALAFKWVRILWKCWKTHTPYNEAVYLQALAKRKSPLLPQSHAN
jgi:transposase